MEDDEIISRLRVLADPDAVAGMARYGISPQRALGVSIPKLRKLAKEVGRDQDTADSLWASGLHEARILATMVAEPDAVDEFLLEEWAAAFDSWDLCDQAVMNLIEKTSFSWEMATAWSGTEPEFQKRAGFTLMARLAVSDKAAPDKRFPAFLPLIARGAADERNYVKKSVSWALRQIGKRSRALHEAALAVAGELATSVSHPTAWVGKDAWRELSSKAVRQRIKR